MEGKVGRVVDRATPIIPFADSGGSNNRPLSTKAASAFGADTTSVLGP